MLGLVWWAGYALVAVWLQTFCPGLDFLVPGFIVSLQEERWWRSTCWLFFGFVLLQDGMGSLPLGYPAAWYGLMAVAFHLGRRYFEARSFMFMCMLGVIQGMLHVFLSLAILGLEGLQADPRSLAWESALQVLAFPVVWYLTMKMFPERLKEDERTA